MNAEFNVWLLIVGLVVGAGLAWLVMMDGRRRDAEIDATELPREAAWLSAVMAEDGYEVSPDAAEQLLLLHRAYLGAPPPDPIDEVDRFEDEAPEGEPRDAAGPTEGERTTADTGPIERESSTEDWEPPAAAPTEQVSPVADGSTEDDETAEHRTSARGTHPSPADEAPRATHQVDRGPMATRRSEADPRPQ